MFSVHLGVSITCLLLVSLHSDHWVYKGWILQLLWSLHLSGHFGRIYYFGRQATHWAEDYAQEIYRNGVQKKLEYSIKRDNCVMFPSYCEHTGAGGDLLLTSSNVNIVPQFCVLCRTDPTRGLRALLVTSSAACCQLPSGRVAVTIYVTPATHTSQYICNTSNPYLTIYVTPATHTSQYI